ncbi:unnamed protein product [Parascedosporium putredinis]|uniref:Uncharacterized protein n=1 Tax=Parascedosporium putredinis TaxID=1442378 RepID=A0A9P1MAZ1_9PEZI|nr:unnamed protein product [Parascedosporium putredinis]CAI7998562.1 unnamed protein product [Parascedosporium putredinis]
MQFTISAAALMAFVSTVVAQVANFDVISAPGNFEVVEPGKPYTIKTLIPDPEPVAAGVVNSAGTFKWNVPATLGDDAIYGLRIQLDSDETHLQVRRSYQLWQLYHHCRSPKTTIVTTTSVEDESKPTAVPTESVVPESGATRSAAGAVAILGGLAIAAFGL